MRKALLALLLAAVCALMFQTAVSAGVAPPTAKSHGASLGEWAKRFFAFDGAIPVVNGSHPALEDGAVDCSRGQAGKVWFLETAPSLEGDFERRCTIPTGTALYVPVFQWVCSPEIFAGEPLADCLAQADGAFADVELSLSVDGKTLDDAALEAYRAETGPFTLPLAADNFWSSPSASSSGRRSASPPTRSVRSSRRSRWGRTQSSSPRRQSSSGSTVNSPT